MIQGAMAARLADLHPTARLDRLHNISPRQGDGRRKALTAGQVRGNGRGQGAARAMHIVAGNSARLQALVLSVLVSVGR